MPEDEVRRHVGGLVGDLREGRLVGEAQGAVAAGAATDEAQGVGGGGAEPLEPALRAGDDCLLAGHHRQYRPLARSRDQTFVQFRDLPSGSGDELRAAVRPGPLRLELRREAQEELLADRRPH